MPQAGSTHTVQSTHTEFGVCLRDWSLKKKTTIKKKFSSDFLEGWGNMRRYVGGQEVNKTNINQQV